MEAMLVLVQKQRTPELELIGYPFLRSIACTVHKKYDRPVSPGVHLRNWKPQFSFTGGTDHSDII